MEWLDGVSVREVVAIDAMHIDREVLADELLRTAMQQMFVDGHFHADLHPGNVLVSREGHDRTHRLRRDRAARPARGVVDPGDDVRGQPAGRRPAAPGRARGRDRSPRLRRRPVRAGDRPVHVPQPGAGVRAERGDVQRAVAAVLLVRPHPPTGVQHLLPGDDHARGDAVDPQPGVPRHRGVAARRRGVDPGAVHPRVDGGDGEGRAAEGRAAAAPPAAPRRPGGHDRGTGRPARPDQPLRRPRRTCGS